MVAAADSCRGDRVGSISFDRVALSLHPARILWAKATGCRCCFSWRRWGNCGRPCLRGRRRADPPALRRRLLFFFEEILFFFFYIRLDEWRWFDWKRLREGRNGNICLENIFFQNWNVRNVYGNRSWEERVGRVCRCIDLRSKGRVLLMRAGHGWPGSYNWAF